MSLSGSSLQNLNLIKVVLCLSSQNENKHREFKLPPFCRVVVSIANLIGTSPSRVETIRAWLKPAHSFCRGVCCVRLHSTSNNVAPAHANYKPRIHTNTCEQEINMASEMENVPESFVFSSKDPTCCDLLRAFAHIG